MDNLKIKKIPLGDKDSITDTIKKSNEEQKKRILEEFEKYIQYTLYYSPKNIQSNMQRAKRIVYYFDITTPCEEACQNMHMRMARAGRKNTTIKQYVHTLNAMAKSMKINFKKKAPKITKTATNYLSMVEFKSLLNCTNNLRDYAILYLLGTTGLRNSECYLLYVKDLDLSNKIIHVRNRGEGIKEYQEKKVVLTDKCVDVLSKWLQYRAINGIDNDYLFISNINKPFASRERLNDIVKDAAKKAGINRRITCHTLRHTAAMIMLRSGVPITSISKQLGHKSIKTTVEYYLHNNIEELKEDIAKFENSLDKL